MTTKKLNRKAVLGIKIASVVVVAVIIGFIVRAAINQFVKLSYNASLPTTDKFAKLSKWMPKTAEFYMVVDTNRILENEAIKDSLVRVLSGTPGVAAELAGMLISKQSVVGMLALVGQVGERGEVPQLAIIAQGAFDEEVMIPAIRTILSTGHAGLVAEDLDGRKLYSEGDVRDPFGFVILDKNHIAVGDKSALTQFYSKNFKAMPSMFGSQSSAIFGHVTFGSRFKSIIPSNIQLSGMDFESPDGSSIVARIPCADPAEAQNMKMFFEGVRSLMLLQEDKNPFFAKILNDISIESSASDVTIKGKVENIIDFKK